MNLLRVYAFSKRHPVSTLQYDNQFLTLIDIANFSQSGAVITIYCMSYSMTKKKFVSCSIPWRRGYPGASRVSLGICKGFHDWHKAYATLIFKICGLQDSQ